jgi:hypothetical protein
LLHFHASQRLLRTVVACGSSFDNAQDLIAERSCRKHRLHEEVKNRRTEEVAFGSSVLRVQIF